MYNEYPMQCLLTTLSISPGVLAHFFSHPMLAPLCKVSYCMYLVSLPLQTMTTGMAHKNHYDQLTAVSEHIICMQILMHVYNLILVSK